MTDPTEFYCFRLTLNPKSGERIEIMLHASALVDLIHECSQRLCEWQQMTTEHLILQKTGLTASEARERGLIA